LINTYIEHMEASNLVLIWVCFGLVWVGLGWFGWVWLGWVWLGLVGFGWFGWFGLVWFGLVWFGLVWFGLVGCKWLEKYFQHMEASNLVLVGIGMG
jgi:hypothetical protein